MTDTLQEYEQFKHAFFDLFTTARFRDGRDFLSYLNIPAANRSGDEASVVDSVIVAPLLGLLGFTETERVYNAQKSSHHRPDFVPHDNVYGDCFVIENKSTTTPLTTNLQEPESTLSQLRGYARLLAVRFGLMTNGQELYLYEFKRIDEPDCLVYLDILGAIREWQSANPPTLSTALENKLYTFFDHCRKAYFTTPQHLEDDLACDEEVWRAQALKLGQRNGAETVLVDTVRNLVNELQRGARLLLDQHLDRVATNEYRDALHVRDDYQTWIALVQETMLGGLSEEQRRDEFALQAAYVIFIRLLLIRVCEDKGIFKNRLLSDGGIVQWQHLIKNYFLFTNGDTNTYEPLLNIAYENAQNIYAQFFTRRELFNWFRLNQQQLILALHRLNRFDFASVNSDILGTIYNTYVGRKEKRDKGQYYTPPEIVTYMLDTIGYTGTNIIGSNKRLLDPACGSGSFLVTAAQRLVEAYTHNGLVQEDPVTVLERIHDNLYGFDLNPFACYLSEVNLLIQVLDIVKVAHDKGHHPHLQPFHIYNTDALESPRLVNYYARFNPVLAEEQQRVETIKGRSPDTPYAHGFAFVVANPPYGATLSDDYKVRLREDWPDIFYGQPDTYTFFLRLGTTLLSQTGTMAFITPNTYLMGTNTRTLRQALLAAGRIEQIVDLPQGIWDDANVDCVLLFLAAETDEHKRHTNQIIVHMLDIRDTLSCLPAHQWKESLTHSQALWANDPNVEFAIRHTSLLQNIEHACLVPDNGTRPVLRLGDITESSRGLIPPARATTDCIRIQKDTPTNDPAWKPYLDGDSFVGRYEIRWHPDHKHIRYGSWLFRQRDEKFFTQPKILLQYMRNRALHRRLVAAYDDTHFYNRDNFSIIIARSDVSYNLKYILALCNSLLLNYWYAQKYDNVNITPNNFRQLPIYPATPEQQETLVALVDQIRATHAHLNIQREQGYTIRHRRTPQRDIDIVIPYDLLIKRLQRDVALPTITLFDARAVGLLTVERKTPDATHAGRAFVPDRYPTTVVVRHQHFWFDIPDEQVRIYVLGYLNSPQWKGATWDDLKNTVRIPETSDAFTTFFAMEQQEKDAIRTTLDEIDDLDAHIDTEVLNLYGITNPADRQRILGSAPLSEEDDGT